MTRETNDSRSTQLGIADIARTLDHSLLRPNLNQATLEAGCFDAVELGVASVCILPYFVRRAARLLESSTVVTSTTIGFPHGTTSTAVKLSEARAALDAGARELDAVVNVSCTLSGEYESVAGEIEQLVRLTHEAGARLKMIFENCYLEDRHKIELCRICSVSGVDWVKTSTGFGPSGATLGDVRLMRQYSADTVQVKASGGIADLETVLAFLDLGATRIGTSKTRAILDQAKTVFS